MRFLSACGGDAAAPPAIVSAPVGSPPRSQPPSSIVAWGDSLTNGGTASSPAASYPAVLAEITGRHVDNEGISGQRSTQIAARQGGVPARLTLEGNLIPPAGPAHIQQASEYPITVPGPAEVTGTLGGVHGALTLDDGGIPLPIVFLFTRSEDGSPEMIAPQTPFIVDTFGRENWINVLWLGRNNYEDPDTILSDLRACANFLTTDHYIVLGLLNANDEGLATPVYEQIVSLNSRMAQAFGDHYLDIRQVLIDHYDPTNPQDQADHANDVPPSSLRANPLHPNDAGYRLIAETVAQFIDVKGW